jgi:hypothetical protein
MAKESDKESDKIKSGAEDSSVEPNYLEPGESGRYAGTTFGATRHKPEGAFGEEGEEESAKSSDQIGQEPNFEMPVEDDDR